MASSRKSIQESLRWPNVFAQPEAAQSLVANRGWQLVLLDLKKLHEDASYKIVHEIRPTPDGQAEQNFQRGQVAMLERLLEFEEELKEWLENRKQT